MSRDPREQLLHPISARDQAHARGGHGRSAKQHMKGITQFMDKVEDYRDDIESIRHQVAPNYSFDEAQYEDFQPILDTYSDTTCGGCCAGLWYRCGRDCGQAICTCFFFPFKYGCFPCCRFRKVNWFEDLQRRLSVAGKPRFLFWCALVCIFTWSICVGALKGHWLDHHIVAVPATQLVIYLIWCFFLLAAGPGCSTLSCGCCVRDTQGRCRVSMFRGVRLYAAENMGTTILAVVICLINASSALLVVIFVFAAKRRELPLYFTGICLPAATLPLWIALVRIRGRDVDLDSWEEEQVEWEEGNEQRRAEQGQWGEEQDQWGTEQGDEVDVEDDYYNYETDAQAADKVETDRQEEQLPQGGNIDKSTNASTRYVKRKKISDRINSPTIMRREANETTIMRGALLCVQQDHPSVSRAKILTESENEEWCGMPPETGNDALTGAFAVFQTLSSCDQIYQGRDTERGDGFSRTGEFTCTSLSNETVTNETYVVS